MKKFVIALLFLLTLTACASGEPDAPLSDVPLDLTSPAFTAGEAIPAGYTCTGDDISPELYWTEPPEGTLTFALIMDDPDAPAGTWVHWVLYNLPGELRGLPIDYTPETGVTAGNNSWNRQDYGGPCPPSGEHRYFFKLYALDTVLAAEPGLDKDGLLEQIEGHVLAQGELMGVYAKP
ncbi:MAG TPA: YbhB/YbcL family Raf kinase inhibitor-like protein [Anaerolineales bacterium]|nr:YbhB/YbcL family Raf kinase inhibitor-like protein [Anaerolineales bacterium]